MERIERTIGASLPAATVTGVVARAGLGAADAATNEVKGDYTTGDSDL